ncbi:hypothetical protein [Spirilliplanes yamanashiensis]|uniref:Lipoprotein n=1 Tax=Spirilliplanes yamanashiensis TaxID=42233 RepID=A0A8J3Y4F6_9ACTN|nr:hypothetical protein [Spirilliplanes yamanashiensis]MDP9819872.1 hypothetical protein [Spirilliplanes yamanashiensis]GIJ01309.1 hypothetical protein Sya03_06610 [Spirilliplanes yamanashiensis]
MPTDRFVRRTTPLAVLAAVVALAGCTPKPAAGPPPAPAVTPSAGSMTLGPPSKADLAGVWCGEPGETVMLSPDSTFVVEGLSEAFTKALFDDDGYVGDNRLQAEFGGVRPTIGAGRWALFDAPTFLVVDLGFDRLGTRAFEESFGLSVSREGSERHLYFSIGDPDDGNQHRFTRCEGASTNV